MSCPFYGCALVEPDRSKMPLILKLQKPPIPKSTAAVLLHPPTASNRCALITSAHSPCWMEVGESASPSWERCPRNPEFVAITLMSRNAPDPTRQELRDRQRVSESFFYLILLAENRKAAGI